MLQKISSYIQEHNLLLPQQTVVVCVSGGADSVAMLHVLQTLAYPCVVAHCNFHLRGEESDRDEAFVQDLAKAYRLPFYKADFDTVAYAEKKGISIEMSARDLRYEWFYGLCDELKAQAIAVAHNADDNIETLLMNLVRGTGLRGLCGIPCRNNKVVRPLLSCSRVEIEDYLQRNKIEYITDSTNALNDYLRNQFRNQFIPLLENLNPALRQTLYDSLEHFNDSYRIYSNAIEGFKQHLLHEAKGVVTIDTKKLQQQVGAKTLLFEILQPYGFNSAQTKQIFAQLNGEAGRVFFSPTYRVLKDRKKLILSRLEESLEQQYFIKEHEMELSVPFGLSLKKREKTADFKPSKAAHKVQVDYEALSFPLVLRTWREGDVFIPFGMKGKKKLSDFFVDLKFSRLQKEQTWVLLSEDKIVWVVGCRVDNRFRVSESTRQLLEMTIEE